MNVHILVSKYEYSHVQNRQIGPCYRYTWTARLLIIPIGHSIQGQQKSNLEDEPEAYCSHSHGCRNP